MPRYATDLTGNRYGKLLVIKRDESKNWRQRHDAYWVCQCDCGNMVTVSNQVLKNGSKTDCGCMSKKKSVYEKHVGEKHNRLTIIDFIHPNRFICRCDCGTIKEQNAANVLTGKAKSCGCLVKEFMHEVRKKSRKRLPIDLTGYVQGRLTIIKKIKDCPEETWLCRCECGNECEKSISLLYAGVQSCGCFKSELSSKRFTVDMTGKRFGKLTVVNRAGTVIGEDGAKCASWLCHCDCGSNRVFKGCDLRSGKVRSYGCVTSFGESSIRKILDEFNVIYKSQYSFKDLKSKKNRCLRFDFGILNKENKLECLIEYQGSQHYYDKEFGKQQREETDPLKKEYCEKHSIPLYEIKFNEDIKTRIHEILEHTSYANTVLSLQETA